MFHRACELIHNTTLLHLALGTLSLDQCIRIAKDHLMSKGVKTLIDLPPDEMFGAAVDICTKMNDEAIKRKDMKP